MPFERADLGDEAFGLALDRHRRDVVQFAYRYLGSVSDAEEAAQETALRAWRSRRTFHGESSLRTWLHRIAIRVCIDLAAGRRHVLPMSLGLPASADQPPDRSPNDVHWLQPLPDELIADAADEPDARYSLRESVSLAFLVALHSLPPRQGAVLLLRDVLAMSATETAAALEISAAAANSALARARATLKAGRASGGGEPVARAPEPDDPSVRALLDRYVRAWELDDIHGLVATLRDEVRLAMPPSPSWYEGRETVGEFLERWVWPQGPFRLERADANGQPGYRFVSVAGGTARVLGWMVVDADPRGISGITVFMASPS